jgi:hypothetical protein
VLTLFFAYSTISSKTGLRSKRSCQRFLTNRFRKKNNGELKGLLLTLTILISSFVQLLFFFSLLFLPCLCFLRYADYSKTKASKASPITTEQSLLQGSCLRVLRVALGSAHPRSKDTPTHLDLYLTLQNRQ